MACLLHKYTRTPFPTLIYTTSLVHDAPSSSSVTVLFRESETFTRV